MEDTLRDSEIEIDLWELGGVLLSKLWLILLAGLIAGAAGFGVSSFLLTEQFESTASMYVMNRQNESTVTYSDLQSGTQLTKDYRELITSRPVLEEVIEELGLALTTEELKEKVAVETPDDTRILHITLTDPDPSMAQKMTALVTEAASEQIKEVMELESVNIFEEASYSDKPVSPNVVKYTLLFAAAGIFAVCAALVLRHVLDDTIKTSEDVERYLGTSVIGLIPVTENGRGSRQKKKVKIKGDKG